MSYGKSQREICDDIKEKSKLLIRGLFKRPFNLPAIGHLFLQIKHYCKEISQNETKLYEKN